MLPLLFVGGLLAKVKIGLKAENQVKDQHCQHQTGRGERHNLLAVVRITSVKMIHLKLFSRGNWSSSEVIQ